MLEEIIRETYGTGVLFKWVVIVSSIIIGSFSVFVFFSELIYPKLLNRIKRRCNKETEAGWIGVVACFAVIQSSIIIFPMVTRVFFPIGRDFLENLIIMINSSISLALAALNPFFLFLAGIAIILVIAANSIPLIVAFYSARSLKKLFIFLFCREKQ